MKRKINQHRIIALLLTLAMLLNTGILMPATALYAALQRNRASSTAYAAGGVPLSSVRPGKLITLEEFGTPVEYIVIQQDRPHGSGRSAVEAYDTSCDGTWVLRRDIAQNMMWSSGNDINYANSSVHQYLNGAFLDRFSAGLRTAIKTVKIPYHDGTQILQKENGLSAKAFLLRIYF